MARGQRDPELEGQWGERMARSLVQVSLMEGRRGLLDCIAYRNLSGERREDNRIVIDRGVNPFAWTSNCRWTRQGGTAEPLASAVAPSFLFWLTLIDRQTTTNTAVFLIGCRLSKVRRDAPYETLSEKATPQWGRDFAGALCAHWFKVPSWKGGGLPYEY